MTGARMRGGWRACLLVAALMALAARGSGAQGGTLSSIVPGGASALVPINLTSTAFDAAAGHNEVTFVPAAGEPITVLPTRIVTLNAATNLRRLTVTVPEGLATGPAALRVRNTVTGAVAAGLSVDVIAIALPEVRSAAPGDQAIDVRITGTPNAEFVGGGATRASFGAGVTVHTVTIESPTALVARISVAANAALGPRLVAVLTQKQVAYLPDAFTVAEPQPNTHPQISSAPVTTATVGEPYAYQVIAADGEDDSLTYHLTEVPEGMTVDADGLVAWTPSAHQTGPHRVTLEARDGRGGAAVQSFEIMVAAAAVLQSIELSPASLRLSDLNVAQALQLIGTYSDGTTRDLTAGGTGTTYTSSNRFVATAGDGGEVTPVGNGTATITAHHADFTATATVTVEAGVTLEHLELLVDDITLRALGGTRQLGVRGAFSDGSVRDLTVPGSGTTYDALDEAVAAVSPDGLVTALAAGQTVILVRNGSRTAHATVAVVVSAGSGFLTGEVYDDTLGLPLAGAVVRLLADGGGPLSPAAQTIADARGQFAVPGRAGDAVVRIEKAGFTAVERHGVIPAGGAARLLDARLTPVDAQENALQSVFGGRARSRLGAVALDAVPGGLAADADVRLTEITGQGLAGRLPPGWSPLAAADVGPVSVQFAQPATLRLPNRFGLAAGSDVPLARYDFQQHRWIAEPPASVSGDGREILASLGAPGQVVVLRGDAPPFVPAVPVPGTPLSGVAEPAFPQDATASGQATPRSAPPGDGARAVGAIVLHAGGMLPSGIAVQAHVREAFSLVDAPQVLPLPFTQDLVLYAHPTNGAGTLGAAFPITPSRLFTIHELERGVITVDVTSGPDERAGVIVGTAGGVVTDGAGNALEIPAGATATDVVAALEAVAAEEIGIALPEGYVVLGALRLDLAGASFTQPAILSIARPAAMPDGSQVLLAQVIIDPAGVRRLRIVALGRADGDRLAGDGTIDGLSLPGVTAAGQYVFVMPSSPLGFAAGTITGTAGAAPQALAVVSADTAPFADVTGGAGAYVVGAAANVVTTVRALDVTTGNANGATATAPAAAVVRLDIPLAVVPLTIAATEPVAGATGVALDAPTVVRFSKPVDPDSITNSAIVLRLDGTPVPGRLTLAADRLSVSFAADGGLESLATYTLAVSGVRDGAGNGQAAFDPVSFTTLDVSKPAQPAAGAITAALPDADGQVLVTGGPGAAEAGTAVTATNLRTQETTTVLAGEDGAFRVRVHALPGDEIALTLRDASGRGIATSLTQFTDPDGTTVLGSTGGTIRGAGGRLGRVLARALAAPATFRFAPFDDAVALPPLPAGFEYADRFGWHMDGGPFNRVVSLTLSEAQQRFTPATVAAAPFAASASLVVPPDFLVNGSLRFSATAQDAGGNVSSVSGATLVLAGDASPARRETQSGAHFPIVYLAVPEQALPNQEVAPQAVAPAARVDFELPAPDGGTLASFLLARVAMAGGDTKLSIVDRLDTVSGDGGEVLVTNGRELPGVTTGGPHVVVGSHEPLVFVTGRVNGPAARVEVDGLPFVFDTTGPNAAFGIPVPAGQPFTLRFVDAATGAVRGSASGQAPASGTVDVGQPLAPVTEVLTVSAEPSSGSMVELAAPIVFTFSAPVDVRTVTSSSILVTDAAGSRVFGTFAPEADASRIAFTPARRWRFGTRYRFGVSTSVLALSGARLAQPFAGEFTTFAPRVLGSAAIDRVRGVAVSGGLAVAAGDAGLTTVDVSGAADPLPLATVPLEGGADAVRLLPGVGFIDRNAEPVTGTLGVVVGGGGTARGLLQIVDLNSPAAPAVLGSVQLAAAAGQDPPAGVPDAVGRPRAVAVGDGERAFVAIDGIGVEQVALAEAIPDDPSNPGGALGARFPADEFGSARGVAVLGDRVLAAGPDGLTILDAATLEVLGAISTSGHAQGVAGLADYATDLDGDGLVAGRAETFDLAVVANGADGTLLMLDVTDPAAPRLLSVVRLEGEARSVVLEPSERLAYVATGVHGIAIVDLAGPASIQPIDVNRDGADDRLLGRLDTPGVANGLALNAARGVAYVADGASGLTVAHVLPPRTAFETLLRDPEVEQTGDEESIIGSRRAFASDEAVRVGVSAALPADGSATLVIEEVPADGGPRLLAFEDGATVRPVANGASEIVIRLTGASFDDRSDAQLRVLAGGRTLATLSFSVVPHEAGDDLVRLTVAPSDVLLDSTRPAAQVSVTGVYESGRRLNLTRPESGTTYVSNRPGVASVDPAGLVTAGGGGTAQVIVTNGTVQTVARVSVDTAPVLTGLEVTTPAITLRDPAVDVFVPVVGRLSDGTTVPLGELEGVTFTTSDEGVVSVDPTGRLAAAGIGLATVSATRAPFTADVDVSVDPRGASAIAALALEPVPASISLDEEELVVVAAATGTGSLDGLLVQFDVTGAVDLSVSEPTDTVGRSGIAIPLDGAGDLHIVATLIDPASGAPRSAQAAATITAGTADAEGNDTHESASPLADGLTAAGRIDAATDGLDVFRVDAFGSGLLTVTLSLAEDPGPGSLRLVVRNAAGAEMASVPITQAETDIELPVTPGEWYVTVAGLAGAFDYELRSDFDQANVTIAGIAPASGGPGTLVAIDGAGFVSDVERLTVSFGAVVADVVSATPSRIEARVPANAPNGPITVVAGNRRARGPVFTTGLAAMPPMTLEPARPGMMRQDPSTGELVDITRLYADFAPSVTRASVEELASSLGGRIAGALPVVNAYSLEFPANRTLDGLATRAVALEARADVELVAPSTFGGLDRHIHVDAEVSSAPLDDGGTLGRAALDQISLFEAAHEIRRTPPFTDRSELREAVVAVIDGGFNPGNPDEFTSGGSRLVQVCRRGGCSPTDVTNGSVARHGTAVASIIGAVNNGDPSPLTGVLNAAVDPGETPFPVLFFEAGIEQNGETRIITDEATWALGHIKAINDASTGVDAVNMSFGDTVTRRAALNRHLARYRPFVAALSGRTLVVMSAGNDNVSARHHSPSRLSREYNHAITVGAVAVADTDGTGEGQDERAEFGAAARRSGTIACGPSSSRRGGSNCGADVNIAAPGEDIPAAGSAGDSGVIIFDGTSAAAPLVAGAAGLLQTIRPEAGSPIPPDRMRRLLTGTADDISGTWNPGRMRRLNVLSAVKELLPFPDRQKVLISDSEAVTEAGPTGAVIGIEVDPLTGQPASGAADFVIALEVPQNEGTDNETTLTLERPTTIAVHPYGDSALVAVRASDPLGDGLLEIDTRSFEPGVFIPLSGAVVDEGSGTQPDPVHFATNRPGVAYSRDGRLLYVTAGERLVVVNLSDRRVVRRFSDLPPPFSARAAALPEQELETRLDGISQAASDAVGGGRASLGQLAMSSDGRTLYATVHAGGGTGNQPGALLAVDVDLYRDGLTRTSRLESSLSSYLHVREPVLRMRSTPEPYFAGDEPSDVAVDPAGKHVYLANGGVDYFQGVPPPSLSLIDVFKELLFGTSSSGQGLDGLAFSQAAFQESFPQALAEMDLQLKEIARNGQTILSAPGLTGVFDAGTPAGSFGGQQWFFPSDVIFGWNPPPGPGRLVNQFHFRDIFAKRPFGISLRPDGRRGLITMFQTGNIAVLDLDAQEHFGNAVSPASTTLFSGIAAVTPAVRLDNHLWPSRGAFTGGDGTFVPSPDERLLFPADIEYAQNGRFAVAVHTGTGSPRTIDTNLPNFQADTPLRLRLVQLGYDIAPGAATGSAPDGSGVSVGSAVQFERGGGAVTFVDDRAISADFETNASRTTTVGSGAARPFYSAFPVCGTRTAGEPGCDTHVFDTLFDYGVGSTGRVPFARPRGVAIQPFVSIVSPRFGDPAARTAPVSFTWRDSRVNRYRVRILDAGTAPAPLDPPALVHASTRTMTAKQRREKYASRTLASLFGSEQPQDGRIYRIEVTIIASGGDELSATSIDVRFRNR